MKKTDPINSLYRAIKLRDPGCVSRRTLDIWSEGLLAVAASKKWTRAQARAGTQRLPKPTMRELLAITWGQLAAAADEYTAMDALRRELRPVDDEPDRKFLRILLGTLNAVQQAQEIPPECLPIIEQLHEALGDFLAEKASPSSPQDSRSPRSEKNGAASGLKKRRPNQRAPIGKSVSKLQTPRSKV